MAERDDTIHYLAGLIRAALYGDRSVTARAEAMASSLGIGPDDPVSVTAIKAALAKALGAVLTREQLGTALSALEDAADYRREYQDGDCADCDALPEGGRCGDHDCDEAVAGMYDLLHEELQEHQGRRSTPGLAEARGETGECKRIGGCLAEIGARTKPNSDPGLWKCGSCGRGPWDIPADVAAIPWGESR